MRYFAYLLLSIFLVSCTSNTIYKKPKDVIPRDSMILLLSDMYLASASKNVKNRFKERKQTYLPLIYEKYEIDSVRFYSSNNYYTSQIEVYEELLQEVKLKIQVQLDTFQKQLKIQDSIKKAKREARKKRNREINDSIANAKKKKDSISQSKPDLNSLE